MQWYTVKVKYIKEFEDGAIKKVTEAFLLQAETFTDAEARIYEEVISYLRNDAVVTNIAKTDYADIFHYDDSDKWYKCKLQYVDVNPDNGKEKKITQNFLITANNVKDAFDRLHECLRGMLTSFEVPSIVLSPIVDVFPMGEPEPEDRVLTAEEAEERKAELATEHDSEQSAEEESESDIQAEDTDEDDASEAASTISDEYEEGEEEDSDY